MWTIKETSTELITAEQAEQEWAALQAEVASIKQEAIDHGVDEWLVIKMRNFNKTVMHNIDKIMYPYKYR